LGGKTNLLVTFWELYHSCLGAICGIWGLSPLSLLSSPLALAVNSAGYSADVGHMLA